MGAVVEPEIVHGSGRQPLNENGLTMKQQRFVDAYLVTFNGVESCRRAGYQGNDKTLSVVAAENLAKPSIVSVLSKRVAQVNKKAEKELIDVYAEFTDQLAFAKQLKQAARDFLSDTDDPLKLLIVPQAHEIEVVYYDHNDLETIGFGENAVTRPKKKKAQLSVILQSLADEGMEPDKFTIKTVDIRKFALDAIATADMCIDKFARMGGAYQKDKSNEHDVADLIEGLVDRLIAKGWEREAARTFATSKYGAGVPKLLTSGG